MKTTTTRKAELPAPIYAVAGATELTYQQLRRLPEVAARTLRTAGQTAEELRQRIGAREGSLVAARTRVRDSAQRSTATFVAQAALLQDRAVAGYRQLVHRGEQMLADRAASRGPATVEVEVGPVQPGPPTPAADPTESESEAGVGAGRAEPPAG